MVLLHHQTLKNVNKTTMKHFSSSLLPAVHSALLTYLWIPFVSVVNGQHYTAADRAEVTDYVNQMPCSSILNFCCNQIVDRAWITVALHETESREFIILSPK